MKWILLLFLSVFYVFIKSYIIHFNIGFQKVYLKINEKCGCVNTFKTHYSHSFGILKHV